LIRSVPSISALPECTLRWLPVAIAPLSWLDIAPHATCVHPIELRETLRASRRAPRRRARGTEAADGGIIVEECNRRSAGADSHSGAESVPERALGQRRCLHVTLNCSRGWIRSSPRWCQMRRPPSALCHDITGRNRHSRVDGFNLSETFCAATNPALR